MIWSSTSLTLKGDGQCEHEWGSEMPGRRKRTDRDIKDSQSKEATKSASAFNDSGGHFCSLCGAWRGQFGMEPTPELYIEHSIEFLRLIRRVLKDWGTVWWNIGDSYAGSGSPGGDFRDGKGGDEYLRPYNRQGGILKPKDLCLIPFRFALAAQADGWYVRSDIIWHKPSTMPESVNGWRWEKHRVRIGEAKRSDKVTVADRPLETAAHRYRGDGWEEQAIEGRGQSEHEDCPGCPKCLSNDGYVLRQGSWRPTSAHEFIFQLTKTGNYYGDREAVSEPNAPESIARAKRGSSYKGQHGGINGDFPWAIGQPKINEFGRNQRDVWKIPPEGYDGPHFAVFPSELPRRCILASTSEKGNCPKCGKPWARVTKEKWVHQKQTAREAALDVVGSPQYRSGHHNNGLPYEGQSETIGWKPTCKCGETTTIPPVVLDPFCGTGTTLAVAKSLGRYSIGIDISESYCRLSQKRVEVVSLPMMT